MDTAPYTPGNQCSKEAAEFIAPRISKIQDTVLQYFVSKGAEGATDVEMERDLTMIGSTVRTRRHELVRAGLICNSGRTKKNMRGRNCTVWIATEFNDVQQTTD